MDSIRFRCWACVHCRPAVAIIERKRIGVRLPLCVEHRAEALARHEDVVIAPLATDRQRLECRP